VKKKKQKNEDIGSGQIEMEIGNLLRFSDFPPYFYCSIIN